MKRTVILAAVLALCLCVLTGCGCKHEWVDATCEAPKTCTLCGETEGEVLSHSWQNATCETPKTCTSCGVTEGEAMGHSWLEATCDIPKTCATCGAEDGNAPGHTFTQWSFFDASDHSGKVMSHVCTTCNFDETLPIDGELFTRDFLRSTNWNATVFVHGEMAYDLAEYGLESSISFDDDSGVSMLMFDGSAYDLSWACMEVNENTTDVSFVIDCWNNDNFHQTMRLTFDLEEDMTVIMIGTVLDGMTAVVFYELPSAE